MVSCVPSFGGDFGDTSMPGNGPSRVFQHPGLWKGTSTQISRAPYMLLAILRPAMVCVIVYIPIGNQ